MREFWDDGNNAEAQFYAEVLLHSCPGAIKGDLSRKNRSGTKTGPGEFFWRSFDFASLYMQQGDDVRANRLSSAGLSKVASQA